MIPRAWRATRGWSGFSIQFEGQPVSLQLLACMEQCCCDSPKWDGQEAGDAMVLAADGYLREQDLFNLRVEDVVFSKDGVALLLGDLTEVRAARQGENKEL